MAIYLEYLFELSIGYETFRTILQLDCKNGQTMWITVMFHRNIQAQLIELTSQYPVVTLTGPRQSGKTTLVQETFPNKPYINLEEPDTRAFITSDPRTFFANHPDGAILDEIQRTPELMSYIQTIVDKTQTNGMFILTGSHQLQLQLHQAITQSLAGRTALLDLLPLTIDELAQNNITLNTDAYMLNGFYPAIYQKQLNPTVAYRNYMRTYIERDVRQMVNIQDLNSFQQFIQLLAGRVGRQLDINSLGNDIGKAHNTIKNWLSILDASYLIYRLPPYFENFGKRIIKSPKIHFTDVGLASYLLGIENEKQLWRDPIRGHLFENMVFLELLKTRMNEGKEPNLYYYRDNHKNEVDIIIKDGHNLIPIEIKSTATFNPALLKNLKFYKGLVNDRMPIGFLIYAGEHEQQIGDFHILNYRNTKEIYRLIEQNTPR